MPLSDFRIRHTEQAFYRFGEEVEKSVFFILLDDPAVLHDHHSVSNNSHHFDVVSYEKVRHPRRACQSTTWSYHDLSSDEVISSQTINSGSAASARATLCFWPPDCPG